MRNFSTLYQKIYPNDLHLKHELWYYRIKYHIATAVLAYIKTSDKKSFHIADIGGGYGYDDLLIRELVQKDFPDITIEIDVIDPTIDFYNQVHGLQHSDIAKQNKITYIEESLLNLDSTPAKEKYDIIICSEVIEHLLSSEQEIFFAQFNRILKPGGLIALTCPNGSSLLKQLAGLYTWKHKQDHLFEAEFHYRYSHIGVPTIFQVLGLFIRKGFEVKHVYPSTALSSTKNTSLNRILQVIYNLCIWINLFFSTTNVYIATKQKSVDEHTWYNTFSF